MTTEQKHIYTSERGLCVVTVRRDGERRIEFELDDCGDFVDLRVGSSPNRTDTIAVTPDLARMIYDWLGKWLEAQT
jgi:hypothetical protein